MRVSQEEKRRSRARIVAAAARRVRERGIEGTGVADVMRDAGLTHGGFYRHFDTKDALVDAALAAGFDDMLADLEAQLAAADRGDARAEDAAAAVAGFRARYLSDDHVATPGVGCPAAAVGAEVARGPGALRATVGAGVRRMLAALARGRTPPDAGAAPKFPETARARAARELAMMMGAVVIARAADPETAREVLAACRAATAGP